MRGDDHVNKYVSARVVNTSNRCQALFRIVRSCSQRAREIILQYQQMEEGRGQGCRHFEEGSGECGAMDSEQYPR